MSLQKRKLSYWSIDFSSKDTHSFDGGLFTQFLDYVSKLSTAEQLFRDEKTKKAVAISNIFHETKEGMVLYKIIFKSCKYNHSPNYMSSNDGSERPSDKQLYEGDRELTHMCIRIDAREAYTVFEERRNGVSMGGVINYLNTLFKRFLKLQEKSDSLFLWAGIIPPEDFLTSLKSARRISVAEMFIGKKVLGSSHLNLMDLDVNSQENITITVKSKPRESLTKQGLEKIFLSLSTEGTDVSRIRLHGKDINKMNIIIDSLNGKRVDEVIVNLTPTGTVDSYSIFAKIEEVLGITQ